MTEEKATPAPEVVPPEKAPMATPPTITERQDDIREGAVTPFEGDFMEVTIDVAQHLERYGKAVDMILNFIVKRTYAGDWVCHGKASDPVEERTVNMTGAAADRIARDLGIQESNRTKPERHNEEKHPGHYYYECEGDFTFRGRSVHAIGRASTLNPFYSKVGEGGKKPEDIREEYIIRDAYRDCVKQGIKGLFGLRKIPLMKLKELGFNLDHVKFVNFKEGGQGGKAEAAATARPQEQKEILQTSITIKHVLPRVWGKTDIIDVVTDGNEKYSWWGKGFNSDEGKALQEFMKAGYLVTIKYSVKGNYKNLEEIVGGDPQ